jgi:Xaa-Pro dipeptidase
VSRPGASTVNPPLERLRNVLGTAGLSQAVLSHPETLASLDIFENPEADWPVATPFAPVRALLVLGPTDAITLVADFHAAEAGDSGVRIATYPSYSYEQALDPTSELRRALSGAIGEAGFTPGATAVETGHLPCIVASWLSDAGCSPVACDQLVVVARRRKLERELEAIGRASRLADVIQQAIKDNAAPGISEAELAGLALARMYREAGRRVPAILTVTAGREGTAAGGGLATGRIVREDELVLVDTSPWVDGAWSDTANSVFVGTPDAATRRRFDAVKRALHLGIDACKPGVRACDVDKLVREALAEHGPTYPHHTGHGIGGAWAEGPMIAPYEETAIEEGMVLALEPAIYRSGWGGIRLEHVFVVHAGGNEILTAFDHTL